MAKIKPSKYNAREIADLTLMYFVGLTILKNEFSTATKAGFFARRTLLAKPYTKINKGSTDLSVLLHVILGHGSKLKNASASKMFMRNITLNEYSIDHFLRNVAVNTIDQKFDARFLLHLDRALKTQNMAYRSVRRLAQEWATLDATDRQLVMTKLLHFFRAKAPNAEIRKQLERLAKTNKFELKVKNTELK